MLPDDLARFAQRKRHPENLRLGAQDFLDRSRHQLLPRKAGRLSILALGVWLARAGKSHPQLLPDVERNLGSEGLVNPDRGWDLLQQRRIVDRAAGVRGFQDV